MPAERFSHIRWVLGFSLILAAGTVGYFVYHSRYQSDPLPASVPPDVARRFQEFDQRLMLDGRPVHPGCFAELMGNMESQSHIVAVDAAALAKESAWQTCPVTREAGRIKTIRKHDEGQESQWCDYWSYRPIGQSSSGTHAVEVTYSGGGSGHFYYVVLVRCELQPIYPLPENPTLENYRFVLRCLGEESLGDRVWLEEEVIGNQLIIRHPNRLEVLKQSLLVFYRTHEWPDDVLWENKREGVPANYRKVILLP